MISWAKMQNTLLLTGVLDQHSLIPLWQHYLEWDKEIFYIDVSALGRVDSAGLSLLIYFVIQHNVEIIGANNTLTGLIRLYNLKQVLNHYDQ